MKMTINHVRTVSSVFDFVATNFDDGVKYGVWYGGKAPLNARDRNAGIYVGQVARVDSRDGWFAAPRTGSQNAVDLQWFGGFRTRGAAAAFLAAYTESALDAARSAVV
jgi:hypothetical protein